HFEATPPAPAACPTPAEANVTIAVINAAATSPKETRKGARVCGSRLIPSPPSGAERAGVRWGIPERPPIPTSPSHAFGAGPSLSPLKGGGGIFLFGRDPCMLRVLRSGVQSGIASGVSFCGLPGRPSFLAVFQRVRVR